MGLLGTLKHHHSSGTDPLPFTWRSVLKDFHQTPYFVGGVLIIGHDIKYRTLLLANHTKIYPYCNTPPIYNTTYK